MRQFLPLLLVIVSFAANAQKYDKIDSLREGLRKVTKGGKVGFINAQGELVIDLVYDAANGFFEGVSAVKKNGKVGYIDKSNRVVIPFDYDGGNNFSKGHTVVSADKKFWMINKNGKQATLRKYDLLRFGNFGFGMMILDKKWGYVNAAGKEIIPPEYDMIHNYSEGLIGAKRDGKWGYIDTTDQIVLPFEFESVNVFENGIAIVEKNGKAGVIDRTGKAVIPFNYQSLYTDEETGWYIAEKKDKMGMIDQRGKEMIPFDFDDIENFSDVNDGYALVTVKDKIGMIDLKGNFSIPARYDKIFKCQNGYCGVEIDKKYGLVALQTGKEVVAPKYDGIGNIYEGTAIFKKEERGVYGNTAKYGYLNLTGREITTPKYESAENFSSGMAAVKLNNKWGFIDTEGKEVIFPRYERVEKFIGDKAIVYTDGNAVYVDKKGRLSEIPENEKKMTTDALGSDFMKEIEEFMKTFESDKEKTDGKYFVLSTYKATQAEQVIVTESSFPEKQIKKYWDEKYTITDLTTGGVSNDEYVLVMEKGNFAEQSWGRRDTDEEVHTAVREKYRAPGSNYISFLNFINNEWVFVISKNTTYNAQSVSDAGSSAFPKNWVDSKWKEGYSITNMAHGKNRWVVVMSKGSQYSGQTLSITDNITESMVNEKKAEGFLLTDLTKTGGKFYAIYSKVSNPSRFNHDKVILMGTDALYKLTNSGRSIVRNLYAPVK